MRIISCAGRRYILAFRKGEKYPEALLDFLKKEKIRGGSFTGLGACRDPRLAFYDLKKKRYENRTFRGDFEVLGIVGNVAVFGGNITVHQHISIGGRKFKVLGGHLVRLTVGGTLEIHFVATSSLKRKRDLETGLNLFAAK